MADVQKIRDEIIDMLLKKPQTASDFIGAIVTKYPALSMSELDSYVTQFGYLKSRGTIGPIQTDPVFAVKIVGER